MPTTPTFAIPYPCAGETIDCAAFAAFTQAVQDAVDDVAVAQEAALTRPSAKVSASSGIQTFTVAVATNVQFDFEDFDNDAMANLGVNNDRLTVATSGLYVVAASLMPAGSVTTLTSQAVALSQNGTILYRKKDSTRDNFPFGIHVVGLVNCVAGDILRVVYLWTGTGGPDTLTFCEFNARLVSLP